jgi:hypothetical protein
MLDPIITFFETIFNALGRFFSRIIAAIVWPFRRVTNWMRGRHWMVQLPVAIFVVGLVGLYGYFIWQTQSWRGFNPNFVDQFKYASRTEPAGTTLTQKEDGSPLTCEPSAITQTAVSLIDFNVNQNGWVSSMILYKLGLFGMDWDHTPFLDNKASFQRGVNEAVRRATVELVDTLGRMRGTSSINNNLQSARSKMQYDEGNWYWSTSPFGPLTPTPKQYRYAMTDLEKYNQELANCTSTFDARSDSLLEFLDRVASSLGSTSDILRERSENYNSGWFDTRADDRFWFAYGQMYGYYALMMATRADFAQVVKERNLGSLWDRLQTQFKATLRIQPFIVSNGSEDGWIMPTHLATMGFYVLRVRANITEIRDVLAR